MGTRAAQRTHAMCRCGVIAVSSRHVEEHARAPCASMVWGWHECGSRLSCARKCHGRGSPGRRTSNPTVTTDFVACAARLSGRDKGVCSEAIARQGGAQKRRAPVLKPVISLSRSPTNLVSFFERAFKHHALARGNARRLAEPALQPVDLVVAHVGRPTRDRDQRVALPACT